jgi:thymidylate synthase (FAD)
MEIKLLYCTENPEQLIELAARTCYQSQDKSNGNPGTLIRAVIKNGHESVLEHATATFRINGCSRAMTHQLVRHRLCSFSQQSQRYVNEDQFDFVIPPSVRNLGDAYVKKFQSDMVTIQGMYNKWKEFGLKNEDARFVLPNACCSEIVLSANFREYRKIFELRCDSHAQWEIRYAAMTMLIALHSRAPNVFFDRINLLDIEWMNSIDKNGVLTPLLEQI